MMTSDNKSLMMASDCLPHQVLEMLTQLALVLYFAPWAALGLPPLLCVYTLVYQRMRAAARDARRIALMAHRYV